MKLISPTASYQLLLPENIDQDTDGRVSSFWIDGQHLLLQISSTVRTTGDQVSSLERLDSRIAKNPGLWVRLTASVNRNATNQASAEIVDLNGVAWLHSYLVWPHLAVYALISGTPEKVRDEGFVGASRLEGSECGGAAISNVSRCGALGNLGRAPGTSRYGHINAGGADIEFHVCDTNSHLTGRRQPTGGRRHDEPPLTIRQPPAGNRRCDADIQNNFCATQVARFPPALHFYRLLRIIPPAMENHFIHG